MADLSARQRKNVYMSSSIFAEEGPENSSVYNRDRQQELLETVKSTLPTADRWMPDMTLPSPADIAVTQIQGHNAVFPDGPPRPSAERRAPGQRTRDEFVSTDGDHMPLVRAAGRDGNIPDEFWATNVKLSWSDTRHEISRRRGPGAEPMEAMGAQEKKRQDLSSNMFGSTRRVEPSATGRDGELMPSTQDQFSHDPSQTRHGGYEAAQSAAERAQRNLAPSSMNTMTSPRPAAGDGRRGHREEVGSAHAPGPAQGVSSGRTPRGDMSARERKQAFMHSSIFG